MHYSYFLHATSLALLAWISSTPIAERVQDEGTARALRLAEYINVPLYIVHVMSGGAVDEVVRARLGGQRVVAEAVVSGFVSEERMVWDPDFKVRHARPDNLDERSS